MAWESRAHVGERQEDARRRVAIGRLPQEFAGRTRAQLGFHLATMVAAAATTTVRSGGVSPVARSTACWNIDRLPTKAQYCFGRWRPSRRRTRGLARSPSPPANTMDQTIPQRYALHRHNSHPFSSFNRWRLGELR